ncbi:unnamed protein product [Cunninghamella blakesleeana]
MFPTELLFLVFQHFNSKRYLTECSIVCKQWYVVASDPLFYKTIDIYTKNQLELFIHYATNKNQQQQRIGHFVSHIHFLFNDDINNATLLRLHQCCPFVKKITLPNDNRNIMKGNRLWKHWYSLETIPTQLVIVSNRDVNHILTLLQGFNDIDHHHPLISVTLHTHIPLVFKFKLLTARSFSSLLELNLNFISTKINLVQMDMIHISCPHLKKLSIAQTSISNSHHNENNNNNNSIKYHQWKGIIHLAFKDITIMDSSFFTKIFHSYPNLESLFLEGVSADPTVTTYLYFNKYQDLIGLENLPKLKQLKLRFLVQPFEALTKFSGFSQWHTNHPQQLNMLEIPIQMIISLPINKSDNTNLNRNFYVPSHILLPTLTLKPLIYFIQYLDTLVLYVSDQSMESSLISNMNNNNNNNNQFISTCLKSLTICRGLSTRSKYIQIKLFDWLLLFPSLRSFKLEQLILTDTALSNNDDKTDIDPQHTQLKELTLMKCSIRTDGGLSYICQRCPKLEILHLDSTNIYYYPSLSINHVSEMEITIDPHPNMTVLYAPNHTFKEIIFDSINCFPLDRNPKYGFTKFALYTSDLSIKKRDMYFIDHTTYREALDMCMIMHSIDRFRLNGHWIVY